MNKALFIVSLQHELAMAIGNDLDLKKMLKHFLKVCINRLSLSSAHVYLHQNAYDVPIIVNDDSIYQTRHFLSIPKRVSGQAWQDLPVLANFAKQLIAQQKTLKTKQDSGRLLYGFVLPNHGVIIFETTFEFEPAIEKALIPIFEKLSTSCYTCIVYDSLALEMIARKRAEDRASFQAQHDGLTGLYNRQYFKSLLEESYLHAEHHQQSGCVLFVDLNRFKPINDAMGHSVGDEILATLADRLLYLSSEQLSVARFGGDEFIILLSGLAQKEDEAQLTVDKVVEQLNEAISAPIAFDGNIFKLTCSIGYTFFPCPDMTLSDIIPAADIAMYEAKHAGIRHGVCYEATMSEKVNRKNAYIIEMKQALKNNEFCLYYQPQFNQDKELIGAEALLRWHHPSRGMESPEVYIPIAEESDLILEIGQWVLEQACRDIKALEEQGLPATFKKLSINVSPKQLQRPGFKDLVLLNVAKNNIQPNHLGIELTENLLVESFAQSITLIKELKEYGIDCSIDDFGTGYSSLTYLKRIPAALLKIDRSFVSAIDQETEGVAIAKMIIGLGHALNMEVLAEGVETNAELACLQSLGCYQYQGYLFGRPVPYQEFLPLIV